MQFLDTMEIEEVPMDRRCETAANITDLVGPLWSADKTQRALGVPTRAAMRNLCETGSLLGLPTADGVVFYPVAQFETHGGQTRVKPALQHFMVALRERDPWTVAVLLNTPADELDGHTPLVWVRREGDTGTLLEYANIVAAEFSR